MKVIIVTLLISIGLFANAKDAKSKSETYLQSCRAHYQMMHLVLRAETHPSDQMPSEQYEKIKNLGKLLCQDAKARWDKEKKWSTIDNPDLTGCMNAAELVYDPDMDPKIRKAKILALQTKHCKELIANK